MATMGFINSQEDTQTTTSSILVPQIFTHSIAFGQTGCGKTTSFIYPNLKNRLELGHGILLYDYKGKEHLSVKLLADSAGRLNDVVEIGKPWGRDINILQTMNEEELDRFFDNVMGHTEVNQWWQNSAKALGQSILKVLKAINSFSVELSKVDEEFKADARYIKVDNYSYPTQRTLTSLVDICKTFDSLGKFVDNLDDLLTTTQILVLRSAETTLKNEHNDISVHKAIFAKLIQSRENLIDVVNQTNASLVSFGKDSDERTTLIIMSTLTAPLLSLSQNSFFNTNSFDIATALDEGKIVIINSEALSDASLESLNSIILLELTKRTRAININPISVFIDEAQRILSSETDLPIDVLREAKVDIFLSTQNSALLKNKLSNQKFDALMGNLTQKFYFKNAHDDELDTKYSLNQLETFEYISHEDNFLNINSSEPIFIDIAQKMEIEFKYQARFHILYFYAYAHRKKEIVLEYIPRLFKENKLIAIDIKTMKDTVINSHNKKSLLHMNYEVNTLFKMVSLNILSNYSEEQKTKHPLLYQHLTAV